MSLPPLWMERADSYYKDQIAHFEREAPEMASLLALPSFKQIRREGELLTQMVHDGYQWLTNASIAERDPNTEVGRWKSTVEANRFDMRHPICFQMIPCVQNFMDRYAHIARRSGIDVVAQVRQSLTHLYHTFMFWLEGQRVFVVSPTLYGLLRDTELPLWRFSELNFPLHSIYIKFPDDAFQFSLTEDKTLQSVEGAFVTVNEVEGIHGRSREFSMLITGRSSLGAHDDNQVFMSLGVGPDALLSDIAIMSPTNVIGYGQEDMARVCHIILSLMLYLKSRHPDLREVPPARVQNFSHIRSPKERAAAVRNQTERLMRHTKLGYIVVGEQMVDERTVHVTGRHLTTGHSVSGHFKRPRGGVALGLDKTEWIAPYWRGPDMAEELAIRAARIQEGQRR